MPALRVALTEQCWAACTPPSEIGSAVPRLLPGNSAITELLQYSPSCELHCGGQDVQSPREASALGLALLAVVTSAIVYRCFRRCCKARPRITEPQDEQGKAETGEATLQMLKQQEQDAAAKARAAAAAKLASTSAMRVAQLEAMESARLAREAQERATLAAEGYDPEAAALAAAEAEAALAMAEAKAREHAQLEARVARETATAAAAARRAAKARKRLPKLRLGNSDRPSLHAGHSPIKDPIPFFHKWGATGKVVAPQKSWRSWLWSKTSARKTPVKERLPIVDRSPRPECNNRYPLAEKLIEGGADGLGSLRQPSARALELYNTPRKAAYQKLAAQTASPKNSCRLQYDANGRPACL